LKTQVVVRCIPTYENTGDLIMKIHEKYMHSAILKVLYCDNDGYVSLCVYSMAECFQERRISIVKLKLKADI